MVNILTPHRIVTLEAQKGIDNSMIILDRDGKYVINCSKKELFVWNARNGMLIKRKKMDFTLPYTPDIDAVNNILVLFRKKTIYLYSLPNIEPIMELENAHDSHIYNARITPDKKHIITASKKEIKVWSLNGNLEYELVDIKLEPLYMSPAVDIDNLTIAYKSGKQIIVQRLDTKKIIGVLDPCPSDFDPGSGNPSAISVRHNIIISHCETSINIYSFSPPRCLMKILHYQPLTSIRYDSTVSKMAICKSEQINLILDPNTMEFKPIRILDNPDNGAYDIAWVDKNKVRVIGWKAKAFDLIVLDYII